MINKKITQIVFCIIICSVNILSKPAIETEGNFALNSFGSNIKISMIEKISLVIDKHIAIAIFGEQLFRNNSFINSLFSGTEYRFGNNKLQIPIGLFAGIYNLHIGQYSNVLPVVGSNSGLIIWLNGNSAFKISYLAKLYFDNEKIFGNDVFIGFSFMFKKN